MRIGFLMKYPKGLSFQANRNTYGEEVYFEAMARYLRALPEVESAELYAPNHPPEGRLDFMLHVNDTPPNGHADKDVLYLQNGYEQGADKALEELSANGYDGYILLSDRMLQAHRDNGYEGTCIPLGADIEHFYPREPAPELAFDVSYVGNDIKGRERTERFLMPAARFDLGLYGNWKINRAKGLLSLMGLHYYDRYRIKLSRMTRGKIPQERLPVLYSSAKVNLNLTLQDAVDWDFWNLRPLEIMACGGLLISDRFPALEREFGGGVVFTDGGQDLVSKLEAYLEDEEGRRRIARRGMEIVRERHSIEHRAGEVLNYLKEL